MSASVRSVIGSPKSGDVCVNSVTGSIIFQTDSSSLPSTSILAGIFRTSSVLGAVGGVCASANTTIKKIRTNAVSDTTSKDPIDVGPIFMQPTDWNRLIRCRVHVVEKTKMQLRLQSE